MYKMVLNDYRLHFKTGMKIAANTGWFIYIYTFGFTPGIMDMNNLEVLTHLFGFLPLMLGLLLSRMYGGLMSKTFYLCPLSQKQREEYIRVGIRVRIAIPLILFLLLNGVITLIGIMTPFIFFVKLFIMICAVISFNIYCQPVKKSANATDRIYPLLGHYEFYNVSAQLLSIFNMVLFNKWEGNETLGIKIFCGILLLLQLLVCYQIKKQFYHQIMYQSVCFERTTS